MNNFKIETDEAGIALITFDVPNRSMNTLTGDVIRELGDIANTLASGRQHQRRHHHLWQIQRLLRRRRSGRTGRQPDRRGHR